MISETLDTIKQFNLFENYSNAQCSYIKEYGKELIIPADKVILKMGADHQNVFFLLQGVLELTATDGHTGFIAADSSSAKHPIAQLRPSRYEVKTQTESKLIVLAPEVIERAAAFQQEKNNPLLEKTNIASAAEQNAYDKLLYDILSLLNNGKFSLPSLPDITDKIRRALHDENTETDDVVNIINMDQALVAKILKTANSSMYNPFGKKIISTKDALLRIGRKKLAKLVLTFAMQDIFQANSLIIKKKMESVWMHSVKVAAISSIMARLCTRLDPEETLLAGLLHNIGAVVLLNNLNGNDDLITNEVLLDSILFDLQAEVGTTLLHHWNFPENITNTVKYSTDWYHEKVENDDFSEIVNLAQWHAYIGTAYQKHLPSIEEITAFRKKSGNKITPELSFRIIKKSQNEINQIINMFS